MDLIQEHIPPPPQVTPPSSRLNWSVLSILQILLEDKLKLDKSVQEEVERVSKARLAVAEAEDDLSILQQEMNGLPIRLTLITGKMMQGGRGVRVLEIRMMLWMVCLLRRRTVERKLGSRLRVAKRGRWAREGRFGGGSGSARGTSPAQLLQLLRGMSEEDQNRNMGTHRGVDVSSMEGDNPQVGVRVEDPAETPCL